MSPVQFGGTRDLFDICTYRMASCDSSLFRGIARSAFGKRKKRHPQERDDDACGPVSVQRLVQEDRGQHYGTMT